MKHWFLLAAIALQVLLIEDPLCAQAPAVGVPASLASSTAPAVAAPASPSPKRLATDYDGRGRGDGASGAVWVPRVVLSPLYVVSEYILRAPLAVVVPAAEKGDVPRKVYDFFAFGPDHKAGIVPVGFVEFDFNPSVGAYAFWNDAFAAGNDWSLHAEVWPTDWYAVSLKESVRLDGRSSLHLHVMGFHRPDRVFYGVGPRSLQSSQSRYTEAIADEGVTLDWKYLGMPDASSGPMSASDAGPQGRVQLSVGLRSRSVGPGAYGSDPNLQQEAATGVFAIPYDYDGRYTAQMGAIDAWYDSRKSWPAPGTGARIELQAEQGNGLRSASRWFRYGGTASGFLDLTGHQRVLSLVVVTQFADPLGDQAVPFTELASLGGDGQMRGYFARRMVDRSAVAAALHYVWPIGPWLGGNVEAAVGNVFAAHLQGFRPDLLRFSTDLGITTVGVGDYPIEAVIGVGSETFAQGGTIDSIRVAVSVNHGF